MKLELKEESLRKEIELLDINIKRIQETINQDEISRDLEIQNIQAIIAEDEIVKNNKIKELKSKENQLILKLQESNNNIMLAVKEHYDHNKIMDFRNKILVKIENEFRLKYKSEIHPIAELKNGKKEIQEIDIPALKTETFSEIVKNCKWEHKSSKLKIVEQIKLFYLFLGIISVGWLIYEFKSLTWLLWVLCFIEFNILLFSIFIYSNINYYGTGKRNSFYERFFKKNVEEMMQTEIAYLDSINKLEKEIKELIK